MSLHNTDFARISHVAGSGALRTAESSSQSSLRCASFGLPLKELMPAKASAWSCPEPDIKYIDLWWTCKGLSSPVPPLIVAFMHNGRTTAAFGKQTGFYPSWRSNHWILVCSYLHHPVTSFQSKIFFSCLHILYFVFSVTELNFSPLLSWVSGLENCIFSFSYYRGTTEWKFQYCFPLIHSLNTINFSFDAFFVSALIILPQEMRANKSYTRAEEQGTDQISYNAIL